MPEPSIDSMTLRHTTNNGRGSGSPEIPQRVPDAGLAMQGRAVERGQMQQFAIVAAKAQLDAGGGDFNELRDRRGVIRTGGNISGIDRSGRAVLIIPLDTRLLFRFYLNMAGGFIKHHLQ